MKNNKFKVLSLASALALTSALSLVSCSDEAEGTSTAMDNAINVNAMVGSNVGSRAFAAEQNTTTDDLASFSMSAYRVYEDATTTAIDKATYTKGSDSKWTSGTYYWDQGAYTFVAWAKNNEAATATDILGSAAAESNTEISGTYTVENSSASSNASQNDPILAVATYDSKPSDNNVNLTFQHLLSRVSINIYAPLFQQNAICLLDFGFSGVNTTGTFTYAPTAATSDAFASSCWTNSSEGNVGEWADGDDATSTYWWTARAGSDAATAITADNASSYAYGPIVPKTLDTSFPKLTSYYTSGETKTAVVAAPWLNVIPGSNIAEKMQLRLNVYQPASTGASSTWQVKQVKIDLADLKVGDDKLTEYKPGYQYVYNIKIAGKETDDASVQQAEVIVQNVTVQPWNTKSTALQNSSNIGVGSSIQSLIDEIVAAGGYGTLKLTADVAIDETVVIPDGSNITIDLNGHKVTSKEGSNVSPLFKVEGGENGGGALTFTDTSSAGDGSVTGAENGTIIDVESGGKATIEKGTFNTDGTGGAVVDNKNTTGGVEIYGGTYNTGTGADAATKPFKGNTTGIIYGGTFNGDYKPSSTDLDSGTKAVKDENGNTIYVPAGEAPGTENTLSGDVTAD